MLARVAAILLAVATPALAQEASPSNILLVGNKGEDTLSFVDLATGRELGRSATGKAPHEIAISPDGRQAAVVSYGGTSIDIFHIASRKKLRTIDIAPNAGPHGLVWLKDGRLIATTERSKSLTIIDTAKADAVSSIQTGQEGTHMVAVSPDGRLAFTANIGSASVSVIDLHEGRKIRDVIVGGAPEGIAISPDGHTLWVADLEGARVQAFDAALIAGADESRFRPAVDIHVTVKDGTVEEIDKAVGTPLQEALRRLPGLGNITVFVRPGGATIQAEARGATIDRAQVEAMLARVGATFPKGRTEASLGILTTAPVASEPTGERPIRVVVTPDGRQVIVSNAGAGTLTVIDAQSRNFPRRITVGGPDAVQVTILLSPDGKRLFAAETGKNQVAEVDLATGKVLRRLPAGKQGDGLALVP
ncbi:MAG TPA: beta-propeller fold lactonase family protein [Allosphingosinicella sp.]|jgi:YVTN family beta-propeller protein